MARGVVLTGIVQGKMRILCSKDWPIEDQHLDQDARQAVEHGEPITRKVLGEDGRMYERCVEPYLSDIGGVVVTYKPAADTSEFALEQVVQSLTREVTPIGAWTLDIATRCMSWDERFSELTGLLNANCVLEATGFLDHICEADRTAFKTSLDAVIERGEPLNLELRYALPGQDTIWLQMRCVRVDHGDTAIIAGIIADITERKGNSERSDFMMRELDHRVKNLLAIILSIAEITARSNTDIETYKNDFRARLESMARTHNLLAGSGWSGLDLRALIEEELFNLAPRDAITIQGESLKISPSAAQSLAMFVHELAINALKHGGLSNDAGRVTVRWTSEDAPEHAARDALCLVWEEIGGPPVQEPRKEGFGGKVINRIVKRQLDAGVKTDWHVDGIKLTALIPLASLEVRSTPPTARAT